MADPIIPAPTTHTSYTLSMFAPDVPVGLPDPDDLSSGPFSTTLPVLPAEAIITLYIYVCYFCLLIEYKIQLCYVHGKYLRDTSDI